MPSSRRFLTVLSTLLASGCALIPAAALADSVPVGAVTALPEGATLEGPIASQRPLELYVGIEPRDPEALRAYAEEVTNPGSPAYGRYLSVAEFAQRFGPAPGELAAVRGALESQGLEVGETPANHLSLPVVATAEEAEAAFGTEIERIQTAAGEPGYISTDPPQIAADAAPYVSGVIGLDDLASPHRSRERVAANPLAPRLRAAAAGTAAGPGPQPCAEASAAAIAKPAEGIAYTAEKFAATYNLDKFYEAGNFGAGQTIALYEEEPFRESDVAAFQDCYGTHATVETIKIGTGFKSEEEEEQEQEEAGGGGEANLDVQQAIQLAPGARIVVYRTAGGPSSEAEILHRWVSDDTAKVMSSSYGICEHLYSAGHAGMSIADKLLQEAAVQGQTFVVASGDYGAADCSQQDKKDKSAATDFPGSDPFATDVGGTRLEEPGTPQQREYLWNDAPRWGAGGGGVSAHFPMPSYQQDSNPDLHVLSDLSTGETCGFAGYCRQVPDVSADASAETGYVVYYHGGWEVTGGTSAAAPLWAALTALTNASPACGGHTVGFLNPALYSIAGTDYAANFRDIVEGKPGGPQTNNRDEPGKPFPAGPGYDMATGIGVPIGDQLGASLCALANPPAPPAPPTPPEPAPSDNGSGTDKTAAPASSPAPAPAHLMGSRLSGVAKGSPKLGLAVEARAGAQLGALTISVPKGLAIATAKDDLAAGVVVRGGGKRLKVAVRAVGRSIQIRLQSPATAVSLRIGAPTLTVTDGFRERVKAGRTKKVGLVVTTKETGGGSSRFPVQLTL